MADVGSQFAFGHGLPHVLPGNDLTSRSSPIAHNSPRMTTRWWPDLAVQLVCDLTESWWNDASWVCSLKLTTLFLTNS